MAMVEAQALHLTAALKIGENNPSTLPSLNPKVNIYKRHGPLE